MDRALKERIIGAVVLVVFVVLVVPVFLDGPEEPGDVQKRSIPLPGQSEQKERIVVLPRDRSEPVPTPVAVTTAEEEVVESSNDVDDETTVAAAEPEREEPPQQEAPAEPVADQPSAAIIADDDEPAPSRADTTRDAEPDPPEEQSQPARAPPAASTGMWAVQLGSFSSEANANRLAAELKRKGFGAFLSRVPGSSGELLRVRVGPQENRPAAERMAERLQAAGYKGQVVPYR